MRAQKVGRSPLTAVKVGNAQNVGGQSAPLAAVRRRAADGDVLRSHGAHGEINQCVTRGGAESVEKGVLLGGRGGRVGEADGEEAPATCPLNGIHCNTMGAESGSTTDT